jgi:hypothetical protein
MKPSATTQALSGPTTKGRSKNTPPPGTDYTLLVRRLEKAVLENPENARVREVLARQAVWRKLPLPQALEWAEKNEGKSGYVPVRRPMDKADLEEHLKRLKTYGIYLMAPDAKKILHYLFRNDPEYNPHMVDYKLSRLRGTPLGYKRIHSLTAATVDFCDIRPDHTGYIHPLIPVQAWQKMDEKKTPVSGKVQNLTQAVENLKIAIQQVERFLS